MMQTKENSMKRFWSIMFFALVGCLLFTTSSFAGEKYLFVNITDEVSDVEYVKKALENGGTVQINMKTCVQIDVKSESKYAVFVNENQYYIPPTILNFIGDRGWKLHSIIISGKSYLFVKESGKLF